MRRFVHMFIVAVLAAACLSRASVVINEIMYNPAGDDDFEWLELYNTSTSAVTLNGWEFSDGVRFSFTAEHELPANGFLVLAREPSAFTTAYPLVDCAGEYNGKLSNKGEKIVLENSLGETVDSVEYGVTGTWPRAAFNGGSSLERTKNDQPANTMADWAPSRASDGWYFVELTSKIRRPKLRLKFTEAGEALLDDIRITRVHDSDNLFPQGDFEGGTPEMFTSGSYTVNVGEEGRHGGTRGLIVRAAKRSGRIKIILPNAFDKSQRYKISFWIKPVTGVADLKLYLPGEKRRIVELGRKRRFGGTPGDRNSSPLKPSGPAVISLTHTPLFPSPLAGIVVKTVLSPVTSNSEVRLFYRVGSTGEFVSSAMTGNPSASNEFTAAMPGIEKDEFYCYYVIASTDQGETRYPHESDVPNTRRCFSLETDAPASIPIVAFWTGERKSGRRHRVSRSIYKPCTVVVNGEVYDDARVRYRGAHTFRYGRKKSYNLKFRRGMRPTLFDEDTRESSAVLNSMALDHSFIREKLSLELFRRAGVSASENYYIRLYKNGRCLGLYLLMERVNDEFIEKHGLSENGAIIKPKSRKGLKPKACTVVWESDGVDGMEELKDFYGGLVPLPSRDTNELTARKAHMLTNVCIDVVRSYMAVNIVVQKRDANVANFYAYYDADAAKWRMLPWDHDFTWGLSIRGMNTRDTAIGPYYGTRTRRQAVVAYFSVFNDAMFWPEAGKGSNINKEFRQEHLNTISNIVVSQLSSGELEEYVDTVATTIQYEAELDFARRHPRRNSKNTFDTAVNRLKSFMKFREEFLLKECAKYAE